MKHLIALTVFCISGVPLLHSQEVEILFASYDKANYQMGPDLLVPTSAVGWDWASYTFNVGINITEESENSFKVTGPSAPAPAGVPIPWDEDGYELTLEYETATEMTTDITPGVYTFWSTGSDLPGTWTENIVLGSFDELDDLRVTNWQALQAFDPAQPVTIEWEPFVEGQGTLPDSDLDRGFIEVEISHWGPQGTVWVWESEEVTPEGAFGLPATQTSVTIPPNTLVGSPWGGYEVQIFFARIDSFDEAVNVSGAVVATVTAQDLVFNMIETGTTRYWAGYPVPEDQWINTGDWLGWVNVQSRPWVYVQDAATYFFIPPETLHPNGAWMFTPAP